MFILLLIFLVFSSLLRKSIFLGSSFKHDLGRGVVGCPLPLPPYFTVTLKVKSLLYRLIGVFALLILVSQYNINNKGLSPHSPPRIRIVICKRPNIQNM